MALLQDIEDIATKLAGDADTTIAKLQAANAAQAAQITDLTAKLADAQANALDSAQAQRVIDSLKATDDKLVAAAA